MSTDASLRALESKIEADGVLCFGCFRSLSPGDKVKILVGRGGANPEKDHSKGVVVAVSEDQGQIKIEFSEPENKFNRYGLFRREALKWLE